MIVTVTINNIINIQFLILKCYKIKTTLKQDQAKQNRTSEKVETQIKCFKLSSFKSRSNDKLFSNYVRKARAPS